MMNYDLLIFDFDGTLADSYRWFASRLNSVAAKYGFRQVKAGEQNALRQLHARQVLSSLGISSWKLPVVIAHMRKLMSQEIEAIELFEGAPSLLKNLNQTNIEMGIVSSNKLANVETVLGQCSQLINYKECGTSLFGKPRKIRSILRKAKKAPGRALYVGDELRDMEAARETGLDICSVTWGYTLGTALAEQRPTFLVDNMADIFRLVKPED